MRNSKFVIGATSFALAVAGALAFKTVNKVPVISAYTKVNGCNYIKDVACATTGGNICTINSVALWARGTSAFPCARVLRTASE